MHIRDSQNKSPTNNRKNKSTCTSLSFLFSEMQLFLHVVVNISKSCIQLILRLQSQIWRRTYALHGVLLLLYVWPMNAACNGLQRYVVRSTRRAQILCLLVESHEKKKKSMSQKRVRAQKPYGTVVVSFVLGYDF